nr:MAG TPA: hypothetical protein [Caudoviricetes sp.]
MHLACHPLCGITVLLLKAYYYRPSMSTNKRRMTWLEMIRNST